LSKAFFFFIISEEAWVAFCIQNTYLEQVLKKCDPDLQSPPHPPSPPPADAPDVASLQK
jgi:hypothetical protein